MLSAKGVLLSAIHAIPWYVGKGMKWGLLFLCLLQKAVSTGEERVSCGV
jgi:hypothetical protein